MILGNIGAKPQSSLLFTTLLTLFVCYVFDTECDPNCNSSCAVQLAGKCDSACNVGYSLNTTFMCVGEY